MLVSHLVLSVSGSACSDSQADEVSLKVAAWPEFTDPAMCKTEEKSLIHWFALLLLFLLVPQLCTSESLSTSVHRAHSSSCPSRASCRTERLPPLPPLDCVSACIHIEKRWWVQRPWAKSIYRNLNVHLFGEVIHERVQRRSAVDPQRVHAWNTKRCI